MVPGEAAGTRMRRPVGYIAVARSGMECSRTKWNERKGLGWDGVGWSGMGQGCDELKYAVNPASPCTTTESKWPNLIQPGFHGRVGTVKASRRAES